MSTPLDRRARRRLATRQTISVVATRLFFEHGFDQVTVDEIAAAADVGRMTVFNHFPRKEDMFFDRDEEGREILRDAMRRRDPTVSPLETLRRLAHRLADEGSPFVEFSAASQLFVSTVVKSESLKSRARAIRDELAEVLASALAESVGRRTDDSDARLAASLSLAAWTEAFTQGHEMFRRTRDPRQSKAVFLAIVDKGYAAVCAALANAPYC